MMVLPRKTKSVCPYCLRVLYAEKQVEKDGIYLRRVCPEHGTFSSLIWEDDVDSYNQWNQLHSKIDPPEEPRKSELGCLYDCGLCTWHERRGSCAILEVTNRCDLFCPVCISSSRPTAEADPNLQDLEEQLDYLLHHGGPFILRLSGGEPTQREDLPDIIRLCIRKGFCRIQLSTNGLRLARDPSYARLLKESGLSTVFLQFDGVTNRVHRILRGRALQNIKEQAIQYCAQAGMGIVLVPVIAAGINEDQIQPIIEFAIHHAPSVRGVCFYLMSYTGRNSFPRPQQPMTIPRFLKIMEQQTEGRVRSSDFVGGLNEHPFCSFRARYFLSASGDLRAIAPGRKDPHLVSSPPENRTDPPEDSAHRPSVRGSSNPALHRFLTRDLTTFTISGMTPQDGYSMDLDRLRRCPVVVSHHHYGMVPACAYYLRAMDGTGLYGP